ncbi:TonB-dependent siderophore receptor [Massilia sp. DJPM01]|uniref:TonB-dependent receptor n=1 Tax=Massilia sp. DJPM01 TaxID=3024404 RepID=UPI00259E3449|nr:TonB-dependent siderophore receptor [Massilia sp. DJPM01]MDM5180488.1 TonB-dependent siderophore receptor [Massilia sp. DJPM01]
MAMQKTRLAVIIALALPQLSSSALAQTALKEITVSATRDQDADYNPPTSTSATKIDAPLRDIPQTVNVVPLSVLRDQGARSLQDVLKAVPGIGLSHGDGQRDQVTIRGFTAIADQFVDGMRDDALYFRDLSNTEQVEIIKGPASVLYGRGSSGGLINRISKKPGINKNEVSLQAGSWNQRRAEIDVARADSASPVALRVTGAIERADSYRDQQFLDREAFAPSVSLKISDATKVLLQAEYLNDKRVTDFGVPAYRGKPVDVPAGTYYGAANAKDNDYSEAQVKAFGFTLDHRFNDAWSLRNAFRHYNYTLDRNNTLAGAVDEKALTASLNRSNVLRDESGYFNQTELKQIATLAGMRHQLLYGVEVGKQEKDQLFRSQNNIAKVKLFHPVAPVLPFTVSAAPSTDNLGVMTVASAYVQDMAALSAQWKALAGVRFDRFEQETRERRAGQSNLARVDRAWSPRAGLVYQPGETQSYFASFSKSFQPSGESFALAANNAQIAPEETTNKEVGAKFDLFDGNATASVSLFRLERTNIKATDPATNRLIPIGTQRSDGIELTFAGKLGDGWQLWSGYAYLDARAVSSVAVDAGQPVQGKRPTLTPVHSANVWLTKSLGNGFGVGGGANAVGKRFANPGNTVTLPGYATIDAMAYYRQGKVDIQLNAMNLADRQYIVAGHGSNGNLNLPGAPRSVQLTARYAF